MRSVSIGGSLVLRQFLFVGLLVALGVIAWLSARDVADYARAIASAEPAQMAQLAALLVTASQALANHLLIGTGLGCLVIFGVSMPMMHRTIARPVQKLAWQMSQLAAGNTEIEIGDSGRDDEIGATERALGVLRDAMRTNNALVAELKTRDDREARLMREAAIRDQVEDFSNELAVTMTRFGAMTRDMAEASETMTVAARSANEGSNEARTASSNAAMDVSSVANASEQLLESIEEISRQVVQSTNVVKAAVAETQATSAGMDRLTAAARRVGDVVSLISRIAAQTNLLALNATIEAARAGEAGRGFAVVAQEVKTLATQTAKATQDISEQIAEMQAATHVSVAAIDTIKGKIAEVEQISAIIASAVHEQGASTHEIARNVRSAASGAAAMSEHVDHVASAVATTGDSVDCVVKLARDLDALAGEMRVRVTTFTQGLEAA